MVKTRRNERSERKSVARNDRKDVARVRNRGVTSVAAQSIGLGHLAVMRTVMTEGAIFPRSKVLYRGKGGSIKGDHWLCAVGDIVMLTDAEVEMYRAGGVVLMDAEID